MTAAIISVLLVLAVMTATVTYWVGYHNGWFQALKDAKNRAKEPETKKGIT